MSNPLKSIAAAAFIVPLMPMTAGSLPVLPDGTLPATSAVQLAGGVLWGSPDARTAALGEAECRAAYREIVQGAPCAKLFEFTERCRSSSLLPVADLALRLRCSTELVDRRYKSLTEDFARTEKTGTCAAFSSLVETYGDDFDLAEAPELEKGNALKIQTCEAEARKREEEELERQLADRLAKNDCETFTSFNNQFGSKLTGDQAKRLTDAMTSRCEAEKQAVAGMQSCLENADKQGQFCGADSCFSDVRRLMTGDRINSEFSSEQQRRSRICDRHQAMERCLASDPCDSECTKDLRLTITNGPLIGHVQTREQSAKSECESKLAAKRMEEERQRQEQETARRADSTFRLTVCNESTEPAIDVAISYFDYDANDWVVEGWYHFVRNECANLGDRFRKGEVYFFAKSIRDRYVWSGDFTLCVEWKRFRRINKGGIRCNANRLKKFVVKSVNVSEYTQRFVD